MDLSITLVGIIVVIVVIWVIIEIERKGVSFKHRFFAILIVVLLLFTYFSFTIVLKGKSLDLSSWDSIKGAGTLYYSWLVSVFGNFKTLTTNAIHMNWGVNNSSASNITVLNFSNSS
ncbi:MAG: hypothetical protein WAU65_00840 [Candidatus Nanoarchaeia archaeon]